MLFRSLLIVPALLLLTSPARAERPRDTVTLTYLKDSTAVSVCPEQDFFDNEVQIRVGYPLFQPVSSRHLTVKLDRFRGQFRASTKMTDDQGEIIFEEELPAQECSAAVIHAAIAVSIAFARLPEPDPESIPVKECPLAPAPAVPGPPPAPPKEQFRWNAGVAGVLNVGTAPSVLGGPGLSFDGRWRDISAALEVRALFAPAISLGRFTSSYLFTSASLSLCVHYRWALGCARGESGRTTVGDSQIAYTRPRTLGYLGGGVRLGGEWVLSPGLAIRAYADLMASAPKDKVIAPHRVDVLWIPPPVAVSFGVGPSVSF